MRVHLYMAILAMSLIALQCTASTPSELGELGDSGEPGVSGKTGLPGVGGLASGSPPANGQPEGPSGDQQNLNGGGASRSGASSTGDDGNSLGGNPAAKTVTTTTATNAANTDLVNPVSIVHPSQSSERTVQNSQGQEREDNNSQDAGQNNARPGTNHPPVPDVVTTTTTKPVTQLEDTGSEIEDRDRAADEGPTHQAGPPTTVSTTKAAPKQITLTPSRNTVEGEQQHNGRQPSTTPDAGKPVLKDTNTGSSSGEQVHAPELPLEPHTDKGVSKDLTKTQQAQEQSPPLSVQPQTPQSTTTVKEIITPLVHTTSTTTGINKDAPQNNNPPTTSTASELKVPAKTPPASTTVYTNGDNETMPSAKSIASTSEPAKVESTAHLTPLPKLPDALQSLGNKDSSIGSSLHFALTALATLVVMAVAPTF